MIDHNARARRTPEASAPSSTRLPEVALGRRPRIAARRRVVVMASTLLEQTREAHEAIERLERFIVSDFKTEAVTHKERLAQNHRVNRALDEMASRAKRLRATYEDADGARKEEIAALGGGANVFAAFYDRLRESREYHRAYSGFHAADPEQTLVAPFRENVAIAFSGEEANGRYLDLHFAHRAFVNGAFGRKCEYISYLVDLGADGAFASSGGGKGGGDDADDTKTNNAMTPDRAKKFTRAYGEYLDELLAYLGAFCLTLVPIRSRRRGERRSLRTLPGDSLRPPLVFNPDTPRRLSTPLLTPLNSTPTFACMDNYPQRTSTHGRGR